MKDDRRLSLMVGVFALGCLAVFAAAVLSLTSQRGFWTPRYRLVAHFENVQGLIEGAPVRLAGKDVGTVDSVSFGPLGGEQPPVRVELQVDQDVQERIRTDSTATIGTIGLLGDKYIEISMGTGSAEVLANGAEIRSTTPLDISAVVAKGTVALDRVAELAGNVNGVVEEFASGMGTSRLTESAEAISEIVREVKTGNGLLHALIYDPYEGEGVQSISRSLATLEDILVQVAEGDGILHALIYESPDDQDLVMQAVEAGARLNSILARVDRGEGTLGLMLNDPTLYEDLKLLVGGAQRSVVVRSLISLARDEEVD